MKLENLAARVQNSRLLKPLARAFHNKLARKCVSFFSEFEKTKIIFDQEKIDNTDRRQEEEKKVGGKRNRKSGRI